MFLVTTIAALLCALSSVPDERLCEIEIGFLIRAYGVLAVVYLGRLRIRRMCVSAQAATTLFGLLVLAMLPYVYWYLAMTDGRYLTSHAAKWIGNPVGVLAVPCTSFVLFDIRRKPEAWNRCALRTMVELVVLFPVWLVAWGWTQVFLGWDAFEL